jgi:tetratricopeptide (TPR) repeat protein
MWKRLILTSLLACMSVPSLAATGQRQGLNRSVPEQPPMTAPIVQLADQSAIKDSQTPPAKPITAGIFAPVVPLLTAKNYAAAEELLVKLTQQNPDRDEIYLILAVTQFLQKKNVDALISYVHLICFQNLDLNQFSENQTNSEITTIMSSDWWTTEVEPALKDFPWDSIITDQTKQDIEARILADPNAIGPRLALISYAFYQQNKNEYIDFEKRSSDEIRIELRRRQKQKSQREQLINEQLKETLQRHGQNIKALNALSNLVVMEGGNRWVSERKAMLSQSLKLNPTQTHLRPVLANLLVAEDQPQEAQKVLMAGIDPTKPKANIPLLMGLAEIQKEGGNSRSAFILYKQVLLAQNPEPADFESLVQVAMDLGELDQAIELYESLETTEPIMAVQGYVAAARILEQNDKANVKKRIFLLEKAQQISNLGNWVTIQLISAYQANNQLDKAILLAQRLYQQNPVGAAIDQNGSCSTASCSYSVSRNNSVEVIRLLVANRELDKALLISKQYISNHLYTQDDDITDPLEDIFSGLQSIAGDDQEASPEKMRLANQAAIAITEQASKQYPKEQIDFYKKLVAYFERGEDKKQAIAIYKTLQKLDPQNTDYKREIISNIQENEPPAEAMIQLQQILEQDQKAGNVSGNVYFALGQVLIKQNQIPEAIASFKAAIASGSSFSFGVTFVGGQALHKRKYYAEAIDIYELGLKSSERGQVTILLPFYGRSLEAIGQPDRATAAYRKALALTPKDEQAYSSAAAYLILLLAKQGQLDQAINEALTIAAIPQTEQTMFGVGPEDQIYNNPFHFLERPIKREDTTPEDLNLNRHIYQGLIHNLRPNGPSLNLGAAHELLGRLLFYKLNNKPEGLRQLKIAQDLYRQMGRLDRTIDISRQLKTKQNPFERFVPK